jgi:hypothetical protein
MNTCFSSLRVLSSRIEQYKSVHSCDLVMIMLLQLLPGLCRLLRRRSCRRTPPSVVLVHAQAAARLTSCFGYQAPDSRG